MDKSKINGKHTIMNFEAGTKTLLKRIFRQEDFNRFADIIQDNNPTHVDPQFCKTTVFGRTLAHGMHLYANLTRILNTQMPGPGTIQISQELMFPTGTYTDQEVAFEAELLDVFKDQQHARIKTECISPQGVGATGHTIVFLPGQKPVFPGLDNAMCQPLKTGITTYKDMEIGQHVSNTRQFIQDDIEKYAALTGDHNPLCLNAGFAKGIGLDSCIIPGPLLSGMFSSLLGTRLPGRGVNWLKQKLHFPEPAYIGETITAKVTIVRFRPKKALINLYGTCFTSDKRVVCQAESLMLARQMEKTE
ncbi:MAG: hypothetical protein GY729_01930 [Desulfobacteraceae bacterium]|nr:hypothetical protein [Desulfobacteraceae bacterium]